ncbi:MAG: integrase family protein [Bryobacteraceae bacterium]|nr:integrase family protein [Bryobacteraceae bacterium]
MITMTLPGGGQVRQGSGSAKKIVAATQAAIDALPYRSGDWSVAGIPGLIVRCGARTKSFRLQRRVRGKLISRTLGEMSLAQARRAAMQEWARLKPRARQARITLVEAWQAYLEERPLASKTRALYVYNLERYLRDWQQRSLEEIGHDRAGVRALYYRLANQHGIALAAQVLRMLAAVYRYHRRVAPELPECPTVAVDLPSLKPRDWALSAEQLRCWWEAVERLGPVKRMWWLTCLLTGARRGSIEALRWDDVDLARRVIHFRVAKGNRPYTVPAPDRLVRWLAQYRQAEAPPSEWVFPSPYRAHRHLTNVRDDKRGVVSAHHLRHTYRTVLAELGATPDQARLLMGHSLSGDVSRGYITAPLLVESLRPLANAVAEHYARLLGWDAQAAGQQGPTT